MSCDDDDIQEAVNLTLEPNTEVQENLWNTQLLNEY